MNAPALRAFVAILLDPDLQRALTSLERQLQDEHAAQFVRWVAPENIHLTLKFLGNVERARVAALADALARAAAEFAPFTLTARGLGSFPNTRRPNNIWVGLEGDVAIATQLAQRIEDECATLGFPREKHGFAPHLTLGRVKRHVSPRDRAAVGALVEHFPATTFGTIRVTAVHLMQSDLYPSGPIYSPLRQITLAGRGDISVG